MRRQVLILSCIGMLIVTLGCGGGGDSGQPAAPPSTPAPASDTPSTPGPTGTASITGSISYEGEVPTMPPLPGFEGNADCSAKHDTPPTVEMLVLGADNKMANVLVRVTSGLPSGASWPAPSEPFLMNQEGCVYTPHVMGVMVGQTFKIGNADGIMHNVNAQPKVNTPFNSAMPPTLTETDRVFTMAEETPFVIKCDVHPWMQAFVSVSPHPFFSVTGTDGAFTISNLPAGTYEIEAWHERLGSQTATVTVADGETASTDFSFSRPQ